MATGRLRTHGVSDRIDRRELSFRNHSPLEAALAAATSVDWLAKEPGAIIVADGAGQFITRVWNAAAFHEHAEDKTNSRQVGPYIVQPEPSNEPKDSVRLIVEVPA